MEIDRTALVGRVFAAVKAGDVPGARLLLRRDYPFSPAAVQSRRYNEAKALAVFLRDGFVDRYSGQRLVFPGLLRLLSRLMPEEFPFHRNWKVNQTHWAYWELFPTVDHVLPLARGGDEGQENLITTSMLRNAAKAHWTVDEIGWRLYPAGSLDDWDGLMRMFMEYVEAERAALEDEYVRRWYRAALGSFRSGERGG